MPKIRTDRSIVLPPAAELRRIIRELEATDQGHKATLLRQISTDPETPAPLLASMIGRSVRTTRRYLTILREKGMEGFLEPPARLRKLSDSELEQLRAMIRNGEIASIREAREWVEARLGRSYTLSGMRDLLRREFPLGRRLLEADAKGGSVRITTPFDTSEGKFFEFLNLLPTNPHAREWAAAFQGALRLLLPQAERIAVSLNVSSRLTETVREAPGLRVIEASDGKDPEGEGPRMTSVDMRYSSTVEGIIDRMRKGGIDFDAYYPLVVREVYLARTTYLGTIILFYPRSGPDLTQSGAETLDRLQPFLAFCLSDGIARNHMGVPERRAFQETLDDFATDNDLTTREKEVFILHVFGMSYEEISRSLSIAPATIRNHIAAIHRKTGSRSRGELLAMLLGPGGFPQVPHDSR